MTPWQQVLRYPPGYSDDVIILSLPLFVENADYHRYNRLSWGENADGRTADGVTLDLVEHVVAGLEDAPGGLHDHPLYIYGHSAGGQFTERFVWAHPDRIAAAVIGAPGFRTFPDPDVLYPYGLGVNPENPAPPGINLEGNLDEFLSSRIMFWVGDRDKAPDDATAETGLANAQGYGRLHWALNAFEADTAAALARVPFFCATSNLKCLYRKTSPMWVKTGRISRMSTSSCSGRSIIGSLLRCIPLLFTRRH